MHGLAARIDFLGVGMLACDTVSLGEPHVLGGLKNGSEEAPSVGINRRWVWRDEELPL